MKRFLFFLSVLLCLPSLLAQTTEVKTILYLLPFFGDEYDSNRAYEMNSVAAINKEPAFSLVSYWEGAQMALDEYEKGDSRINVVVKDITYNNEKLRQIMEDEELMSQVDLIIGPFFAEQFEIASSYAKTYGIPIVNPFTNKQSILTENEFVYKVQSSEAAISEMVRERWLKQDEEYEILFWTKRGVDIPALKNMELCLDSMDIPYEFIFDDDRNSGIARLQTEKKQVLFFFFQQNTSAIANIRSLGVVNEFPNTFFVIPEEWLEIDALEVDYLNKLNVHFFSDYFVDDESDQVFVFINKFIERYNTPPDLKRFSFQGYDITKYFVELMLNEFDLSQVQYEPLTMKFDFHKLENGGYENHGVFLLQLKDYKIQPAE